MTRSSGIEPLPEQAWPAELGSVIKDLNTTLNVYNTMANHPPLLQAWMPLRQHVVVNSSLNSRVRELLILRHARNTGTDYEWQHHVIRGKQAGITDEEIEKIQQTLDVSSWSGMDAALLLAVDELNEQHKISELTWQELVKYFSKQQMLDIIATVGMYTTLTYIVKSCGVALEDDFVANANAR